MNILAKFSLLIVALLVSWFSLGFPSVAADELPADTNKIESLTPEQADRLLADFPRVDLVFDLHGFGTPLERRCLPLSGLQSLDAEVAAILAAHRGPLLLNGLTRLSPEVARALAKHESALYLNGLTTLSAETAGALAVARNWEGNLPKLTSLDSPDSVAIAQALASRKGPLKLPSLKKITPKTLTTLIEKRDVAIPSSRRWNSSPNPTAALPRTS